MPTQAVWTRSNGNGRRPGARISRATRRRLLAPLVRHYESSERRTFPEDLGLPEEFQGLRAEWHRLDRFVGATVERAFSDGSFEAAELKFPPITELRGRLGKLEEKHPEAARACWEAFAYLSGALLVVQRFADRHTSRDDPVPVAALTRDDIQVSPLSVANEPAIPMRCC